MPLQLANCLVALGGDAGNTVPKYGVTAAEIAVLRVIHGDDAIADIEPTGSVERSHKAERSRLVDAYARIINGAKRAPEVETLYPGAAARVFETLDELDLDSSFFKTATRVTTQTPAAPVAVAVPEAGKPKRGRKAKAAEPEPAPAAEDAGEDDEDDGIKDMPSGVMD